MEKVVLVEKYIQIYERLCAAMSRGDDVDPFYDQLNGLWSKLTSAERAEVEEKKEQRMKRALAA